MGTIGFILLLALAQSTPSKASERTIDLPNRDDEGELGDVKNCPSGSYVSSVRLLVKRVKGGDETGVNGVEMQCRTKAGDNVGTIKSAVLPEGDWLQWKTCGRGFIKAAQLKDQTSRASGDKVPLRTRTSCAPTVCKWATGNM